MAFRYNELMLTFVAGVRWVFCNIDLLACLSPEGMAHTVYSVRCTMLLLYGWHSFTVVDIIHTYVVAWGWQFSGDHGSQKLVRRFI